MEDEQILEKLADLESLLEKTKNEATKQTQRAVRAEAIAKLSADTRTCFDKFGVEQQDAYLAGDDAQKAEMLKGCSGKDMEDEDKELEKTAAGRKLLELRKENEALRRQTDTTQADLAKLREERDLANFAKRADTEIPNIPGDSIAKGRVLYSLNKALKPAEYDGVMQMLKAGDAALATITAPVSKTGGGEDPTSYADAEKKLDALAKARHEKNGGSYAVAYKSVVQENPALYRQATEK
jgi:hypothetical protein